MVTKAQRSILSGPVLESHQDQWLLMALELLDCAVQQIYEIKHCLRDDKVENGVRAIVYFPCQQRPTHVCLHQCRHFPISMPNFKCNVFKLRDKSVLEFTPRYLHAPAYHLDIRSDKQ